MGQPKVSIVMPVHNVEKYLGECLESAINQTLKDIEIICVNGGSTDRSLKILQQYAQQDSRIRIISHGDVGLGANMNTGIAAARGEYIGILETDDYIQPDMYETLYRTAKEMRVDFVKSDYESFVDENGIRKFEYHQTCLEKSDYYRVWNPQTEDKAFAFDMSNWTGIFRTAFVRKNNVRFNETPGASYQDNAFWFLSFASASRVLFIDKAFYMLRRDNPNSSVNSREKVYCMCDVYDFIREYLEEDAKKFQRFIYLYQYYKFGNYTYTLNRIAYQFKHEFVQRFSREFREAMERDELRENTFLPNQWRDVNYLINDPEGFFRTYYYNAEEELKLSGEFGSNEARLKMAIAEIEAIHASASYRIGRFITWLPRKLRRILQYVQENGIRHTFRRFKAKYFVDKRKQIQPHEERLPLPKAVDGVPRISVVLAVKNAAKYLEDTLESILRQSLRDIEVICVYDESSDDTYEILTRFAEHDDRLKILKGQGCGVGSARNIGLKQIRGEYLICLDGDDIFELSMLEELYRAALRHNADIAVCMTEEQDERGRRSLMPGAINLDMIPDKVVFNCMDFPDTFFRSFIGWAWDKLIKTQMLRENDLQFGNYYVSEDAAFAIPAMVRAERITVLRNVLITHRKHELSLEASPTNFRKHWKDVCTTFQYIKDKMEEWEVFSGLRLGYLNWVIHYSLWMLDHVSGNAFGNTYDEMRIQFVTKTWPELGITQLCKEDFLYQNEREAFEKICGSLPSCGLQTQSPSDVVSLMTAYQYLKGDYDAMQASLSFRIGRVITWLPRKVRGGVRCLKENGLRYTFRRCVQKLMSIGG